MSGERRSRLFAHEQCQFGSRAECQRGRQQPVCLEKAFCNGDDIYGAAHKNTRGRRAEADVALHLTVSQPRLFNLLDRVLGVTTEFGMVSVARTEAELIPASAWVTLFRTGGET